MTPRNWPAQQLLLSNRAARSQTLRLGVAGASDVAIAVNHRARGTTRIRKNHASASRTKSSIQPITSTDRYSVASRLSTTRPRVDPPVAIPTRPKMVQRLNHPENWAWHRTKTARQNADISTGHHQCYEAEQEAHRARTRRIANRGIPMIYVERSESMQLSGPRLLNTVPDFLFPHDRPLTAHGTRLQSIPRASKAFRA